MFRLSISEKHLCFIPALLLASQIYYRILFLQSAAVPEVVAFSIVPTALASLAIGIFFRRTTISKQNRFLLHTLLATLLIASTLLQPVHFYGAELIILCILTGMIFASIPDTKGIMPVILPALVLAGLLFTPSLQVVRYFNFILLPFAQFCLLCAYFVKNIPRQTKIFNGIPLLFSFVVLLGVTWFLIANRTGVEQKNIYQHTLQLRTPQNKHHFLSLLALISQEKHSTTQPLRITIIENEPLPVTQLLESLKKIGLQAEINKLHPDFSQNAQRILPFLKPENPAPAELHEWIGETDLAIIVPPIPNERSSAFLSSASFFSQIYEKLPPGGILAVFANGTPEQNLTIYHSMPPPVKDKEGSLIAGTTCLNLGDNAALFVCRKEKELLLDSKLIAQNLPQAFTGYKEVMELVFPTLLENNMPPQDPAFANRPFHQELLWMKNPPARAPFFLFLVRWHGLILAAMLGIYLLLRYFISWKPVHKPCFQAFEAGLLVMLLLAGTVIGASATGGGPIFSLIPTITSIFCATYFCSILFAANQRLEKYDCIPLLLVVLFFLLGWNLPAATAMIAALVLKVFLKRQTPELPPEHQIFPKIWMMIGMSVALTAASIVLILPT